MVTDTPVLLQLLSVKLQLLQLPAQFSGVNLVRFCMSRRLIRWLMEEVVQWQESTLQQLNSKDDRANGVIDTSIVVRATSCNQKFVEDGRRGSQFSARSWQTCFRGILQELLDAVKAWDRCA